MSGSTAARLFDPSSIRQFRFLSRRFDAARSAVVLEYALDDQVRFVEEIVFPGAVAPTGVAGREALARALEALHLAAGVSYYKAAAPPQIQVESGALSPSAAQFFGDLYLHGLGEFAYRNQLDLADRLRFPSGSGEQRAVELDLPRRTAVPIGGGKDSVVTLEALRSSGEPMVLFSVGDFEPIRATAERAGIRRLVVERRISPRLLELNQAGALNGHVPVSAVIAFILVTAAVLYGFDSAALSNEGSADEPELVWKGRPINHEYSKGLIFEQAADRLMSEELLAGFRYFSFLRPLSELSIAARFAELAAYHPIFRSCNAAFRLAPAGRAREWCGQCPKCRFVFLILAPFVARARLVELFGADLLSETAQSEGYAELLGFADHRPFECVGGERDSLAALALIVKRPEWQGAAILERFRPHLPADAAGARRLVREAMTPSDVHRVPERLHPALSRLLATSMDDRERSLATLGTP
jgi:hypothetical protein